jgi:hypothetical protein
MLAGSAWILFTQLTSHCGFSLGSAVATGKWSNVFELFSRLRLVS